MKPERQASQSDTRRQAPAELWPALEQYAVMQEEHLRALRRGRLRELPRWQVEREKAFAGLRQTLEFLGDLNALADRELAQSLRERISALLATENQLRKEVREGRQRVREQLTGLRKGRTAVRRLGTQPDAAPGPRFVSSMA